MALFAKANGQFVIRFNSHMKSTCRIQEMLFQYNVKLRRKTELHDFKVFLFALVIHMLARFFANTKNRQQFQIHDKPLLNSAPKNS